MNGLLKWIGAFRTPVERVFVVHGEDSVTEEFCTDYHREIRIQHMGSVPLLRG